MIESGKLSSSYLRFATIWNGPVPGRCNEMETFRLFESLSLQVRAIERMPSFQKCGKSFKKAERY
jgi:hypothetical protein